MHSPCLILLLISKEMNKKIFITTFIVLISGYCNLYGFDVKNNAVFLKTINEKKHQEYIKESSSIYHFVKTKNYPPLIFCNTGNSTSDKIYTVPTLFVRKKKRWEIIEFPEFQGSGWDFVGSDSERSRIWAILDHIVEGPGNELYIIVSNDAGNSWKHLSSIRKIHFEAFLSVFRMGHEGAGELIICLEHPDNIHRKGYYSYKTNDWGRTWKEPYFMPNIIFDADLYKQFSNKNDLNLLMNNLMK